MKKTSVVNGHMLIIFLLHTGCFGAPLQDLRLEEETLERSFESIAKLYDNEIFPLFNHMETTSEKEESIDCLLLSDGKCRKKLNFR